MSLPEKSIEAVAFQQLPEIVFGIAGPIGVDIEAICDSLAHALHAVRYNAHPIHLTKDMMEYELSKPIPRPIDSNFYSDVTFKIQYANALCDEFDDPAMLARVAIRSIKEALSNVAFSTAADSYKSLISRWRV